MRRIRHIVRVVALFLIILILVVPVYAENDLGLNVNGVTATTENQSSDTFTNYGDGSWTNSDGVLSGLAKGKKGVLRNYTGKATLTFSIPKAGTFSFKYKDIELNNGSLTIDGSSVTTAGTFSKEFTEAGTVTVVIQSAKAATTTKATIYDISFLTSSATSVTFKAVSGVDYTVNGIVSVTQETGDQVVSISTDTVSVTASYDDSTQIIREWKAGDGSAYSLEESGFVKPSEAITLTPVLGPRGTPQFTVNGARYYTWDGAFTGISNTTVTVTQSGTLPAGNYTVPAGITLLIPFDTAGTCYTSKPADDNNLAWETPSPYRTLTLASDAHLTIDGAMSLSAKHHTGLALENCGLTTGKYGHVDMAENSTITVNNGGVLYAWGYITGSGTVTVKSGAKSYEYFVIQDFKDGNSLSDLSTNKDKRVFITNNYYVQNVLVPVTIEAGGYLHGYSSCFFLTLKISKHASISFITPGSENGMFKLSTGKITKRYDYATDRMYIDLDGTAEMGNISITASTGIMDITIDSVDYDMPIGSNITLTLKPDASMSLANQSLVMIPGSELYIEEGASLNVSSGQRFVLHDLDQWQKNYSYNARVHPLAFVPNRTYKFQDSDLKDPLLVVNGTVDASDGYLYVTAGGGDVRSTGYGVVKFPAYSTSTNSQYMRSERTFDDYTITSAWLKNADGSFVKHTADSASDYYYNVEHGKWVLRGHTITDTVTAPTCTAAGYTTHTCTCGYSYKDTYTDALGHSFTKYEWDESKSAYVAYCDNGCGETDERKLCISLASMTMANSLNMNFAFEKVSEDVLTGYYVVITKTDADGNVTSQTITVDNWKTTTISKKTYYYATFTGIAAKEMTDKIHVAIYNASGVRISNVWVDSVQDQAMRNLAKTNVTDKSKTMVVDMLNYGAAAQNKFGYATDNLATSKLTDAQKACATDEVTLGTTASPAEDYLANVILESNIQFVMALKVSETCTSAKITFTNHYGVDQELEIKDADHFELSNGYYVVTIESTVIADSYKAITCKWYDSNGAEVGSVTDSIADYATRALKKTDNELYEMLIKFSTSAYAYFHPGEGEE